MRGALSADLLHKKLMIIVNNTAFISLEPGRAARQRRRGARAHARGKSHVLHNSELDVHVPWEQRT